MAELVSEINSKSYHKQEISRYSKQRKKSWLENSTEKSTFTGREQPIGTWTKNQNLKIQKTI